VLQGDDDRTGRFLTVRVLQDQVTVNALKQEKGDRRCPLFFFASLIRKRFAGPQGSKIFIKTDEL
jgi:hypothetical protein